MSDRIKSNDIIDDELFIKVSQNAESFYKNLTIIEAGLKAVLEEAKKVMATTVFANSADLEKYTEAVLKAAKANEILAKSELIKEKAVGQSIKNEAARTKEAEKARKESEKATKQAEKEAKAQAALSSEYKQASIELKKLEDRLRDNAIAGRDTSVSGKMLIEYHKELKAKVIAADQSVGDFRRNVGNYKSGFDGLGMSINQLTREFPAFANSVQTGFMAISNNLPIFFDEIKKTQAQIKALRAEGQQVPGLFSQLATSLFSWGTALSLGVTLLTLYGKELVEFTANLFKADEAFTLSSESQSKYYQELTKIIEKRIDAQLKLNVLNKSMTEEQANNFKDNYEKSKQARDIEKQFYDERLEIAKNYKIDVSKVNGQTSQTDFIITDFDRAKKAEEINKLYFESKKRRDYALLQLDKQHEAEAAINKAEDKKKQGKLDESDAKKAAALNKKRNEEGRQAEKEYDEIWKRERQKLNDWIYESETNRFEWEQQNTKTKFEEEYEAQKATNEAIEKLKAKHKKKLSEMNEEEKKEYRKQLAEKAKEEFDITISFLDQLNRIKADKTEKYLSNEIDKRQRNIQQQQQLAAQGLDNTLAFEKEALAKAELQRQQEAKKREREAKTLAFLKLIASFADKGDNQAVMKAFLQMAIATAITGSFAEGVEGLEGPGTETSDSILARLSKNESVITAKGTKQNPGLATAMNKGKVDEYFENEYLPKYMVSHDVGSFAENAYNSLMLQQFTQMNNEIKDIKKALKERPVSQTNLNNLGEVVETKITNGFKKITTHKNTNNYL